MNIHLLTLRDSVQTLIMSVKPGLDQLPKKLKNLVTKFKQFSRTFQHHYHFKGLLNALNLNVLKSTFQDF